MTKVISSMEEAEKIVDLVWRMVFGENYIDYEQFRLLEKSKDPKAMGIYMEISRSSQRKVLERSARLANLSDRDFRTVYKLLGTEQPSFLLV